MQADYILDYDVISTARERRLYVLARIKTGPAPGSAERRPLNLSVVLDRSGSMSGDKIDYVKQAANFLVQRLGGQDRLSVVSYNQQVKVEVPPQTVQHKDLIRRAIDQLKAGGTTNLSGGWLQGIQLVSEGKPPAGENNETSARPQINRVLLLTDGLANEGVTNPVQLASMAAQKRGEGITTTTMGVGLDFNEDLLTRMASEGGGAFYFIDEPDQTPKIFAEELQDLLNVVGQNLVITLTLSPEVSQVRQLNVYPARQQQEALVFQLGDLFADEIKSLALEFTIPALQKLGEVEVARMRFDYDELGENESTHRTLELPIFVNVVADHDYALQEAGPNEEVLRTVLMLRAARAREEAIQQADSGNFEAASAALGQAADDIQQSQIDDPELLREHDMLREEAVDMEFGAQRYTSHTRKATATKSHYTERGRARRDETVAIHARLKGSREALERSGPPPRFITWKGNALALDGDLVRIGRDPANDIVVPEGDISAFHCQIVREGGELYLEDLNSTNGTFANGGRLHDRFHLSAGDVMTVGSWLFLFREDEK